MKKFTLFFAFVLLTTMSFAQVIHGISWVNWANEPDYEEVVGYADNPYDNPMLTIYKAPDSWSPISDAAGFDATWDLLGDPNYVANPTDVSGGDLFDLEGDATFGAAWKGVHDGENFYILLKYYDTNAAVDADSKNFEIMAQPTSYWRHEPTFVAAADSTAENTASGEDLVTNYQNQAYARSVNLGGGKAVFADGFVNEYAASYGVTKNDWQSFWSGNWGANEAGLEALLDGNHFWEETDGVLRAVMIMSLDGALSYPTDPFDLAGDRTALAVGDTFSFDVKSNAAIGDDNIAYFWSSDKNNGYGSNYYSGHLTLSEEAIGGGSEPADFVVHGISWVNWANEPDYEGVTGYADNPYNNPEVTVYQAPDSWTPVADVESFEDTWGLLGDPHYVANPTDVAGGDLFDLMGDASFGAAWKGVHDGSNFYILLKYWDTNGAVDADSRNFEIMAQPTSIFRHQPTFDAAADSTAENTASGEDLVTNYQNQSYARSVNMGGGKAVFADGFVNEYAASYGVTKNDWQSFWSGNWGANEAGLEALLDASHFWDETDGVIRAVMVMSLDGALSYPTDPNDLAGDRTALEVGETFAFDVKSNAKIGDDNISYFWSSDKNNGYGSNYYSGHVTLSETVVTGINDFLAPKETSVFMRNDVLHVKNGQPVDLEVYSILGARLKSAQKVTRLPMHDLQDGIYLIRVEGNRRTVKVVKN